MSFVRIVLFGVATAITYGIAHDQFTVRLSIEYFTIGHPPLVPTSNPTLLALGWGVLATWWVGLPLGVLLAVAARAGSRPTWDARDVRPYIARLLILVAAAAVSAGALGWVFASRGAIWMLPPVAELVVPERHARYLSAMWAHFASYVVGGIGALVVAALVFRARGLRRAEAS